MVPTVSYLPSEDTTELIKTVKVNYFQIAPVTQSSLYLVGNWGQLGSRFSMTMRNKARKKAQIITLKCLTFKSFAGKKQSRIFVSPAHSLLEKPVWSSKVSQRTEKENRCKRPGDPMSWMAQSMHHLCQFCEMNGLDPMSRVNCFCSPKTKCPPNSAW